MDIEVFTEGSGTTANRDEVEFILDFFEGVFLPVRDLSKDLGEYGNVTVHILSDEYGYVHGSDDVSNLDQIGNQDETQKFSNALFRASQTAEVVVILLTQATFEGTVCSQWENIVSNTQKSSIWCFGASRDALSSIDLSKLQSSVGSVIVYKRVGVARISSEYKEKLQDAVANASPE
jgi:hypothetical protein